MKKITKLVIITLVAIMFLSGCNKKTSTGVGKTVEGVAKGLNGDVKVSVTLKDDKITEVKVLEHKETPGISDKAISDLPKLIVEKQSLALDVISGATYTSKAILEAVTKALKDNGLDAEKYLKNKAEVQKEPDKTIDVDVAIIGAGGAGLAAAVTAAENGKKVLVVEKMSKEGGNTILAGGALNAVENGSEMAKKHKDSTDLHYKQTLEGGDNKGNPKLVRVLVDNAADGIKWLESLGMKFKPETFTVLGGLWPRAHKPVEPVGTGFFKAYMGYIEKHDNVEVMFNTKAEELLTDKEGRVVGFKAKGKTGNTITVNAKNGVILATGGFSQNVEMRQKYNKIWKDLGPDIKSTNHPGATGDGILMAEKVNAHLVGMEYIQLLPMGDPETGSLSGNIEKGVESRIFVNDEGKRFVDEGERRDVMTKALMEQPNKHLWTIVDSQTYKSEDEKNNFNESLKDLLNDKRAFKGETLEELAKAINVDAKNLKEAIETYNKAVRGEIKDPFGRTLFDKPIEKGPFYASPRIPTVHHTMGGVEINEFAQVLKENGKPIEGLYAAGEVTGGIHGTNRLGGNALADILVFGRIAGESASKGFDRH